MKKALTTLLFVSLSVSAYAVTLTPEQAIARTFSGRHHLPAMAQEIEITPTYTQLSADGTAVAYVFNGKSEEGYYILSADDLAYPILGYAKSGTISEDNMPPAMKWWLEEYGRQIEFAASKNAMASAAAPAVAQEGWTAIEPLITTKWSQDAPYNLDCPDLRGNKCVTGCVATSMAQVMNYFKYPEIGEGSISYRAQGFPSNLEMNFDEQPFDWDNMLDSYNRGQYTDEEASAVAYLMKACGYATEMAYSPDMSGTQGELIAKALRTYFKYDGNCHAEARLPYSWNEWSTMIYDNLRNVGPVVINGRSSYGGHSFICDGYDGNGYFHFNWGWGGLSDGYFALDALNPDAQGIGGYAGGYNFDQNAIIGAQKPTGLPVEPIPVRLTQYGATVAEENGGTLTFGVVDSSMLGWGNSMDCDIQVRIGAIIESMDGGEPIYRNGKMGAANKIDLPPGSYIPASNGKPNIKIPSLDNGKYKVTLASLDMNTEDSEWIPVVVEWGMPNYVILTVADGVYSVENIAVPVIEVTTAEIISELYFGCNFKLKATFTNTSDIELSQAVSPVLFSGSKVSYAGQSMIVTLEPGETSSVEWMSQFDSGSGVSLKESKEFEWGLLNQQNDKLYGKYGTVMMKPSPGNLKVSMGSFVIEDAESESMEIDGGFFGKIFKVNDLEDFVFDLQFKVSSGYFDGQLLIDLCEVNVLGDYDKDFIPIGEPVYQEYPFLSEGESFSRKEKLSIKDGKTDKPYAVRVRYTTGMSIRDLGTIYLVKPVDSGVDTIGSGHQEKVEYYDLMGNKLQKPGKGELVIEKKGSSVRKIIY